MSSAILFLSANINISSGSIFLALIYFLISSKGILILYNFTYFAKSGFSRRSAFFCSSGLNLGGPAFLAASILSLESAYFDYFGALTGGAFLTELGSGGSLAIPGGGGGGGGGAGPFLALPLLSDLVVTFFIIFLAEDNIPPNFDFFYIVDSLSGFEGGAGGFAPLAGGGGGGGGFKFDGGGGGGGRALPPTFGGGGGGGGPPPFFDLDII